MVGMLRYVDEQHPDCVRERDGNGDSPLHVACCKPAPFPLIQYLVQARLRNAFTSRTTTELSQCILASQSGASLQAIKYLVEANGCAAMLCAGDNDRDLPLHCAAVSDCPLFNVVDCMVKVHPAALSTRTSSGALPLHVLCGSTRPPLRMDQYLVNAHPAALSIRTSQGDLPITLLRESTSLDELLEMTDSRPEFWK